MFDHLGRFTTQQLQERHAFLRAQVNAIPAVIEHMEAEAKRVIGRLSTDDTKAADRRFPISHEGGGVVYSLATVEVPKPFMGDSLTYRLAEMAVATRLPMRVDPLTGDIGHGDSAWRAYPKLYEFGKSDTDIDTRAVDDVVPAIRSARTLLPMMGVFKRPEALEEKSKKAKYRGMMLIDEIGNLRTMLVNFEVELQEVEKLVSNSQTIINTAGEEETVSEYESAGMEIKTDITPESDVERLIDLLIPPSNDAAGADAAGNDQPATAIEPAIISNLIPVTIPENATAGDVSVFAEQFPLTVRTAIENPIPQPNIQAMANIFEYAFASNMVEMTQGDFLFRKTSTGGGPYKFLPLNVNSDLVIWAQAVFDSFGLAVRVTEAWPPTNMHMTWGHFTGNAVDVTLYSPSGFKLERETVYRGIISAELADAAIEFGEQSNLFTNGLNEYRVHTRYSTGPHIHLNWKGDKIVYNNDARLLNLTTVTQSAGGTSA